LANFTDIAKEAGLTMMNVLAARPKEIHHETTGTGVAIFDYDNDGGRTSLSVNGTKLEGFPTGKGPTITCYRTTVMGRSATVTDKAGLAHTGWGQGVCVATTITMAGRSLRHLLREK